MLEGEAGIGKTTIWRAAVAEARGPGIRILACAPAESEAAGLQALAGDGPVVVAVDDVQWLDAPTARALEFAIRRLGDAPARLLVARRGDHGGASRSGSTGAPLERRPGA